MARSAGKKTTSAKKTTADEQKYLCHYCLKEKKRSEFYVNTDPRVLTGITFICKDCVKANERQRYAERTEKLQEGRI